MPDVTLQDDSRDVDQARRELLAAVWKTSWNAAALTAVVSSPSFLSFL